MDHVTAYDHEPPGQRVEIQDADLVGKACHLRLKMCGCFFFPLKKLYIKQKLLLEGFSKSRYSYSSSSITRYLDIWPSDEECGVWNRTASVRIPIQ